MDEFALIQKYFACWEGVRPSQGCRIVKGIGDDCAILDVSPEQLVVSTDTMVEGSHFPSDYPAQFIASRALGAATSDLAAMGATPVGFTLSLSMPAVDEGWLEAFSRRLVTKAEDWQIPLIGGDTVRGPLQIGITVLGHVPRGKALVRSGAVAGDDVWVSGSLGDAAAGLRVWQEHSAALEDSNGAKGCSPDSSDVDHAGHENFLLDRFHCPQPRLRLGSALRELATAAIDISDGLLADLGHICRASGVGAEVKVGHIPVSSALSLRYDQVKALECALAGGDDYELCFTAARDQRAEVQALADILDIQVTRIGCVHQKSGIRLIGADELGLDHQLAGYSHFSGSP